MGIFSQTRNMEKWTVMVVFIVTSLLLLSGRCSCSKFSRNIRSPWVNHGGGLSNQRVALHERKIKSTSLASLSVNWQFTTGDDVTATPAIADGVVYFPDWGGNLYAVDQVTGRLIWQKKLIDLTVGHLTFVNNTNVSKFFPKTMISRSTPTVTRDLLVVGLYSPGAVIAVCRSTGELIWAKQLDTNPYALITMSGTAYDGAFYTGTSSLEEGILGIDCCTFQGAFFKMDLKTGEIVWKVPMTPENGGGIGGYSGVAVWGSSPSIDVVRRLVFIATGNAYTTPPEVDACLERERNATNPPFPDVCLPADDHQESILAIDLDDGTVTWSKHLGGYDTFNYVCVFLPRPSSANCPAVVGSDYDFGMCPMILRVREAGGGKGWRDIVVAGQKSGFVWALDKDSGDLLWVTVAGPGGFIGGSSWGLTTDGERVFTNMINNERRNFTLLPSAKVTQSAGWVALNATNGDVLWATADPFNSTTNAPLTYANGVVFGGSVQPGNVVALDAVTGKVLWTYQTPGAFYGGISISDGCLFVPVGNTPIGINNAPNSTRGLSVINLCI